MGASGWHYLIGGYQSPWAVLVTSIATGTPITATAFNGYNFGIQWDI